MRLFEEAREIEIQPGITVHARVDAHWHVATGSVIVCCFRGDGYTQGNFSQTAKMTGDGDRKSWSDATDKPMAIREAVRISDEWYGYVEASCRIAGAE